MNTLRYITTNLSKSTLTNTILYQRNISRNISTIVKDDASKQNVKGCCGMDSKNIEVPATAGIIIKNEKIIHKMKGKSSLEPEKSKCNDIDPKKPSWVDKKSACVEKKPYETSGTMERHICGESARKDIFKQVVNDSFIKERKTDTSMPYSSSVTTTNSTSSTTTKFLTTAIVGFLFYWVLFSTDENTQADNTRSVGE